MNNASGNGQRFDNIHIWHPPKKQLNPWFDHVASAKRFSFIRSNWIVTCLLHACRMWLTDYRSGGVLATLAKICQKMSESTRAPKILYSRLSILKQGICWKQTNDKWRLEKLMRWNERRLLNMTLGFCVASVLQSHSFWCFSLCHLRNNTLATAHVETAFTRTENTPPPAHRYAETFSHSAFMMVQ